jgi:hypothetical protein
MSEDVRLPIIPWAPGWKFIEPPGYEPHFVEGKDGVVIDDNRIRFILDALLDEHHAGDRIRATAGTFIPPGLAMDRGEDGYVRVVVAATDEPVGLFDHRLLVVT